MQSKHAPASGQEATMSLQSLFDNLGASLGAKGSEGRRRAAENLIATEEQRRVLKVGDRAPMFSLPQADIGPVSSAELLRRGPLVISFYRGLWCPYCQRDLIGLEEAMSDIRSVKATAVAVSHQILSGASRQFHDTQKFSFPVLDDITGGVAEQFGIHWDVDDLNLIHEELGTDLPGFRGTDPWIRPMQARYVIARDSVIAFAEIAFNYDQRSEPVKVLSTLAQLA
jgi:peroxiredoxin